MELRNVLGLVPLVIGLGVQCVVARPSFWADAYGSTCLTYGESCSEPNRSCCGFSLLFCRNGTCGCLMESVAGIGYRWTGDACVLSVDRGHRLKDLFGFPRRPPDSAEDDDDDDNGGDDDDDGASFPTSWLESGGHEYVVPEARTAPILGFAVFVSVIFLGSVLSVIYVRIKQRAIVERRRNMAAAVASMNRPYEPSAPDLPPSYDDVVAAEEATEEEPPHYKSLTNIRTM